MARHVGTLPGAAYLLFVVVATENRGLARTPNMSSMRDFAKTVKAGGKEKSPNLGLLKMEARRLELLTLCMPCRCSTS